MCGVRPHAGFECDASVWAWCMLSTMLHCLNIIGDCLHSTNSTGFASEEAAVHKCLGSLEPRSCFVLSFSTKCSSDPSSCCSSTEVEERREWVYEGKTAKHSLFFFFFLSN